VLVRAYGLQPDQLTGPDWLTSDYFDIVANVPAGAPKEQIPLMFQDLLAERFKLQFHRAALSRPRYALVIAAGGARLKEAETPPDGDTLPSSKHAGEGENFSLTVRSKGIFGAYNATLAHGIMHFEHPSITMKLLAEFLSRLVDAPVVDMTGLNGAYFVPLDVPTSELPGFPTARTDTATAHTDAGQPVPTASEPSGNSLRGSLQKLGLRLEQRRLSVEMFVVDHVERTPTAN
jgi:uncharacterized protein (TIGR03435 family)